MKPKMLWLIAVIVVVVMFVAILVLPCRASAEPGMFFPLAESQRLLQALDERDQFKAEVEALKQLDVKNQAIIQLDRKLIEGKEELIKGKVQLLKDAETIIESKDRLIKAHESERDYWKKRTEQAEPGFFAKLWGTGKVGVMAAGGAVVGSAVGPVGTAVGALIGALIGGGL